MKLLIADDDRTTRILLKGMFVRWGYEVVEAQDGDGAWDAVCQPDPPRLAVLDWEMPGIDGIEICRRLSLRTDAPLIYAMLLTRKTETQDLVHALDNGAHDFLSKPVDQNELRSRIAVGCRLVAAEDGLREAMRQIQDLHGLLPICAHCKRIRDDEGYWEEVEGYIMRHAKVAFSHSICPRCRKVHYPDFPDRTGETEKMR